MTKEIRSVSSLATKSLKVYFEITTLAEEKKVFVSITDGGDRDTTNRSDGSEKDNKEEKQKTSINS